MNDSDAEGVVRRDRFSGGPARDFLSSLAADERIFGADLAVDRAHVVMLAECDIVDDETAGAILGALDEIEAAGHDALPEGEDVHEAIETAVIDRVGPDGGRMHTARSRNDEVATCIRYRLREDVLGAVEATLALREALAEIADVHTETIMPGYTHLQPAQPTTVAQWALSYESAVARDTARLFDAFDRLDASPLGAAAFAGTPFEIDRERTAELLGFSSVLSNATDAVAGRDVLLETTQALSTLATTLSGLAEDLIVFANRGFVDLADDYSSTSSIMPQKVNPDTLELVRAVAGDAAAGVQGLTTTLKGLPRAYNRDLQRATPHVWETVDAVTEATEVAAGAAATADWNAESLSAAAGEGFSTATGVADLLAAKGVPFRTAHEIVAEAAAAAEEPGVSIREALADAAVAHLDAPLDEFVASGALADALDPESSVVSRDSTGGPAPEAVADQLAAVSSSIEADRELHANTACVLGTANERRLEVVSTYV
ncbi:argininosuccinate lyase [Halovivax ruber XH-70]|uniref:Argininosuccinate lyase n=1 Tax=Halovivax ruber (strain DSM 18193 / JCM 13892 / XH-70) TaxID=797302 RepID=L0I674_HALRX|nr:argininosuccinate lyase [Halovivax ruber]AGB15040.1 argininosuccinate lyase [Halovivax ruber XH-70]